MEGAKVPLASGLERPLRVSNRVTLVQVGQLSGGWKMRVALGKMLLRAEDLELMLLDEPTNHMDLDGVEWLETYLNHLLNRKNVAVVVVSHDREFLDRVATKTIELEQGKTRTWSRCNYSDYVEAKQDWAERQRKRWEKWKKELDEKRSIIQRLEGGDNAGRAEQAKKEVEQLLEEEPERPFEDKKRRFRFPEPPRPGRIVAWCNDLTHVSPDGRRIFDSASLQVERGDRVALLGPNGSGKSTLLSFLLGKSEPNQGGSASLGEHNVVPNFFEQNQAEALDLDKSALETVEEAAKDAEEEEVNSKALLGRMGFKGEAMNRPVRALSGGEKARLALARFMATPANLLALDEPTNHMDIPSREALEEALKGFSGSVIAASHDRYFLKQIANRVVYVRDGQLDEDLAEEEALEEGQDSSQREGVSSAEDLGAAPPPGKGVNKKAKKKNK